MARFPNISWPEVPSNIFAGFVVSLIALPLSLGLALASGVPPMAGVISAVVGGIVVALAGGSYVTITGPGNGLAVATLAAVTMLGAGDAHQGYVLTLAAIVVSGALMLALGTLRLGSISDFFPSAAVQGMLAAIGLMIMAKQLHIMLGEMNPVANGPAFLLAEVPDTVEELTNIRERIYPAAVGLLSLFIMAFYKRIPLKWLHYVPAPMWVVVLSVGYVYYCELNGIHTHLPENMMVRLPDEVSGALTLPDFSLWKSGIFWEAAITLTLVASIESLLSVKGVERLDPKRRRANVNKDLRAIGLATMASGALGGLNVVAVIARSSVNASNGATMRLSNGLHGVFLALFILLFKDLVTRIPLPALAAILVYTGYKLAHPSQFIHMYRIGGQQLFKFSITIVLTLFLGLIKGIALGMFITMIAHLFSVKKVDIILRNLFKPNTLMIDELDGTYLISVRYFCNFLNFNRLKAKLDTVPYSRKVVIDFSLADFVDHSTLEHLQEYSENFERNNGELSIIGLDNLAAPTDHPLSPMRPAVSKKVKKEKPLTKRQVQLKSYGAELGWVFDPLEFRKTQSFTDFGYFKTRVVDRGRNSLIGRVGSLQLQACDLDYHEGEFIVKEPKHASIVIVDLPVELPEFILDKERLLDRVGQLAGFREINFKGHPDFNRRFKLRADKRFAMRRLFDDRIIRFFEGNPLYHIESNGRQLLIFEKDRLASVSEYKIMVSFALRLAQLLHDKIEHGYVGTEVTH